MDRWIVPCLALSLFVGVIAFGLLWAAYPDVAAGAVDGALGGVFGVAR